VGNSSNIWTSPDGVGWTRQDSPDPEWRDIRDVVYGDGRFVAVTMPIVRRNNTGAVLTSLDGLSWTLHDVSTLLGPDQGLYGVGYGGGRYVAVGSSGAILWSTDGASWSAGASGVDAVLYDVAYGNGVYVAVGTNYTVVTSTDGASWLSQPFVWSNSLRSIHFTGELFVAVGSGTNQMVTSPDGVNWTRSQYLPGFYAVTSGAQERWSRWGVALSTRPRTARCGLRERSRRRNRVFRPNSWQSLMATRALSLWVMRARFLHRLMERRIGQAATAATSL